MVTGIALAVPPVALLRRLSGTAETFAALGLLLVLPRWIPLAIAGLLLVGVAMTYERRRRDVARLRQAVGRMQ